MRKTRLKPNYIYILVDIVLIILWTYVPYILRYNAIKPYELFRLPFIWHILNFPDLPIYSLIFLFWGIITILVLNNYHLYATDRELTIPRETWLVLKAVVFATLPVVVLLFLFKVVIFSRLIFTITLTGLFISLSLWKIVKRYIVRKLVLRGFHNLNVLIIGAGRVGRMLIEEIKMHPYLGLKIVGFLDDFKEGNGIVNGYRVIGNINDFEKVVRQEFVDEVFVTIPSQYKIVQSLISKGRELGVTLRIVPEFYDLLPGEIKLHHLGSITLLGYHSKGIHGTDMFLKRLIDILVSGLLLLILSPLFLILTILIKLDSPGPVFYKSKRCGRKGEIFVFYKFRSMVKDADMILLSLRDKNEKKGPIFKMKNDPRVTWIGRFIRGFSLDELPQLWNVFKGDMSLVGPRPPTPEEVVNYDPWQMRRLEIKPGITCLWQVRGRSDLSFYKGVKWDIWYIDNWSFWLDLKILLWTLPAVFKTKGAY